MGGRSTRARGPDNNGLHIGENTPTMQSNGKWRRNGKGAERYEGSNNVNKRLRAEKMALASSAQIILKSTQKLILKPAHEPPPGPLAAKRGCKLLEVV